MIRRPALAPAGVVVAGVVALALAACTPLTAVVGASTEPPSGSSSPSLRPVPQPSATAVIPARPTVGAAGCTLSTPGAYRVGDCDLLLVQGDGITVVAGTAGSVRIQGNRDHLVADGAPGLRVEGQDNTVVVGGDVGGLTIAGDRNTVTAQGRIGSGDVTGNDNSVKAAGGVGDVTDGGARNSIG